MADRTHYTGPEHYRQAERILADLEGNPVTAAMFSARMAEAQVHATLALAAATIDAQRGGTTVWEQYPDPARWGESRG